MNKNVVETALGAVVLLAAILFLTFGMRSVDATGPTGYQLKAAFTKIDGISVGADVRVSGIKAGTITGMTLDENYRAVLTMNVDNSIKLPTDSAAVVASSGLLGDKFIALEPGADEEVLKNGDTIGMTQSPPGLEQLLGQVIFSINKQSGDKPAEGQPAEPAAAPATAPATAVAPAPAEGLSE